jgi:predicted nucleic acid-binding protein
MKLLDSNIIIYAAHPGYEWLLQALGTQQCAVSVISQIEVLGYHGLTAADKIDLEAFIGASVVVPLSQQIVEEAIAVRRQHNRKLGDSIIAATALVENCELVTRNTSDFKGITGLNLWNPFSP